MEPVEQVILYVRTIGRRRVVEVANATEFVRTSDLTEMVCWFDQEESDAIVCFDRPNLFFHPLPSGEYAVGLIFPAQGNFFSFLQPPNSFFVRVLVVHPQTLSAYANNPVSLYRDFERRRKIPLFRRPPRRVHPLTPSRSFVPFDRQAVLGLLRRFGAANLVRLARSMNDSLSTLFSSPMSAPDVIDAMLNLYPVRFRTELTFASELFLSARTPLRMIGLSRERRRLVDQADEFGLPLIRLEETEQTSHRRKNEQPFVDDPWSSLLYKILQSENFVFFEVHLKNEAAQSLSLDWNDVLSENDLSDLQYLAKAWLRELDEGNAPGSRQQVKTEPDVKRQIDDENIISFVPMAPADGIGLAVAERSTVQTASSIELRTEIAKQPRQQELLARIDSDLARALFGDTTVLTSLENAWRELYHLLRWHERDRLREEYVALIHSMLVNDRDRSSTQTPQRSVNLLDVLLLFLGE